MTRKKSVNTPTSTRNPDDIMDKETEIAMVIEMIKPKISEEIIPSDPKLPKLTDMTVDDLKILIGEVVAAELQKWSNQSTSKDLDNSVSKKLYINAEGKYFLPKRTPEEIAQQAQSLRDMFAEWEREYDAEEQRETFAYLQKALSDDFPSGGSFSENPLSVSQ